MLLLHCLGVNWVPRALRPARGPGVGLVDSPPAANRWGGALETRADPREGWRLARSLGLSRLLPSYFHTASGGPAGDCSPNHRALGADPI